MNKSQKISSSQVDRELDKISQLSEHLIDKILSLLPIREAVRTSILSSSWRFKLTTISNLVFDDNIVIDESSKLVKIIDRVLCLHSGPVKKFMLSHKQYKATSDIDLWFRYLSRDSITELIFNVWKCEEPMYKVPSSLFYCEGLTSLRLCNCSINVSPTFRGFNNLKILCLLSVTLSDSGIMLKKLISCSDVLEDLTLTTYRGFGLFNYVAPKLKRFCFRGPLIGFGFGDSFSSTFCSPSFHMKFHECHTGLPVALKCSINLLKFFAPLRSVKTLKLEGDVLKYLSVEDVPAVLAEPLLPLKNLFISGVNFKSVKEVLVIFCLLRSAPNLIQLKLLAAEKGEQTAEVDDDNGIEIYDSPSTFAHLKSALLTGIGDSSIEMGFIGILLSSSPALQKMIIKANAKFSELYPSGSGKYKLLKNMLRLQCASTRAELILSDH